MQCEWYVIDMIDPVSNISCDCAKKTSHHFNDKLVAKQAHQVGWLLIVGSFPAVELIDTSIRQSEPCQRGSLQGRGYARPL